MLIDIQECIQIEHRQGELAERLCFDELQCERSLVFGWAATCDQMKRKFDLPGVIVLSLALQTFRESLGQFICEFAV